MSEINIRKSGHAGRITLTRPKALNALSYEMALAISAALDAWREDDDVGLVLIDAEEERAFCAGGDIAALYHASIAGDNELGRRFWRDEYRMNAKIDEFPKPVVSLMQGFTMGGGVGIGCHGTHRIVCETTQIAMPECGIGLIPDVGGTALLARAPGAMGEYLALTSTRMGPADALYTGFADFYVPSAAWPELIRALEADDFSAIDDAATLPPQKVLDTYQQRVDHHFAGKTLPEILASLRAESNNFTKEALDKIARNSPLSMVATLAMLQALRASNASFRDALAQEYRFTYRSQERGDFNEGIRAAVIDKDRAPTWQHDLETPPEAGPMLAGLGANELRFEEE